MPDSNKKQQEQKDDASHATSSKKVEQTGDPGRTPGTAEGDRANVEKWLKDKGKPEERGRPQD